MTMSEVLEERLRSERAKGVARLRELGVSEHEIAQLAPVIEQMHAEQMAQAAREEQNLYLLLDLPTDTKH